MVEIKPPSFKLLKLFMQKPKQNWAMIEKQFG
jgi:hypothetical protein